MERFAVRSLLMCAVFGWVVPSNGIANDGEILDVRFVGDPEDPAIVHVDLEAPSGEPVAVLIGPRLEGGLGDPIVGRPNHLTVLPRMPLSGRLSTSLRLPDDSSLYGVTLYGQAWGPTARSSTLLVNPGDVYELSERSLQVNANFGFGTSSGDFDADGFTDLLIGSRYGDQNGVTAHGEAFVYFGPDFVRVKKLHAESLNIASWYGATNAAGDINGDGYDDAVVGAIQAVYQGMVEAGRAFVFYGPELDTYDELHSPSPQAGAHFGGLISVGDINGDGFGDIGLGAPLATADGEIAAGKTVVFFGPDPGRVVTVLTEPEPELGALFGTSLRIGDLNSDGYADLAVSAITGSVGWRQETGEAFVFWGPDLVSYRALHDPVPIPVDRFGRDIAIGDFNGDGIGDLAVSSYRATIQDIREAGEVWIFDGPHLVNLHRLVQPISENTGQFGVALSAGDVDGDGDDELAVGVEFADLLGGHLNAGALFLFYGGKPPFEQWRRFLEVHPTNAAIFGFSIAFGSFDGTPMEGVASGAMGATVNGVSSAGRVVVFPSETVRPH